MAPKAHQTRAIFGIETARFHCKTRTDRCKTLRECDASHAILVGRAAARFAVCFARGACKFRAESGPKMQQTRAIFGVELRVFAAKRAPTAVKLCASAARVRQVFLAELTRDVDFVLICFARGACKFGAECAPHSCDFRRRSALFRRKTRSDRCKTLRECGASHANFS